jgi:hypothetical protein
LISTSAGRQVIEKRTDRAAARAGHFCLQGGDPEIGADYTRTCDWGSMPR